MPSRPRPASPSGRYHFKSKDDLVAAYLAARDQPNLALFKRWFTEADGKLPDKVEAIFRHLARSARHPKWKGCGFLRTTAELANMPGHPAIKIGAAHKKKFEAWLRSTFETERIATAPQLARQIRRDKTFRHVMKARDGDMTRASAQSGQRALHRLMAKQGLQSFADSRKYHAWVIRIPRARCAPLREFSSEWR